MSGARHVTKALAAAVALAVALPAAAQRGAAPAAAPDGATRQAKAHFQKGTELYRQARYREAIEEFEAAYRLRPHGVIFFNLAQCHERLGDVPAAIRAYHDYLRASPGTKDRATVQAAVANLEKRLGATGVQELLVYSDPPGAEVHVDGQLRGHTPFSAVLPHGTHAVKVARPGYATLAREAVLSPGRSLELDVVLTPAPEARPPAPPAVAGPPPPPAAVSSVPPALAPGARPEASPPLGPAQGQLAVEASAAPRPRVWTWVAAGVSAAALAGGIAYGLAARSASDDLRNVRNDAAAAQRLADSASSRARAANILYGIAAGAGAAGVTLFFVEGSF